MLNNVETNRSGEFVCLEEQLVVPQEENTSPEFMNGNSYLHINNDVLSFADEGRDDNNNIVEETASKRTQLDKSPATEHDDEEDG